MKSEWKEYSMGELYEVHNGLSKGRKFFGKGYPFLSFSTVFNRYFLPDKLTDLVESTEKERETLSIHRGDIFITRTSETYDELGMSCVALKDYPNATFNGFTKRLRPLEEGIVLPEFIGYFLRSPQFRRKFEQIANVTTRASLSNGDLLNMVVSLPPLPVQRKIASILSALDDKIETNNTICRNLEELMESMYNKLFVENYNSEWTQGTISDLGRIVGGGTPSKKEPSYYTQQGISWITPKDLSRNTAKFIQRGEVDITQEGLNASGATIMPAGTVLFSSRAPIGYMAIACNDVTTNQGFKSVIPHDFVGSAYLYYFLKANKNAIEMRASGSTFLEVSAGIMRQVPAIIPDKSTLDIFKHFCNPLFEMQRKLETETVSLSQLRESLLPKLMSGELSIDASN